MQKKNNIFNKNIDFFKYDSLSIFDWVAFFIVSLFYFLTIYYADITVTARFSMVFIDSLFDGDLFSFYDNALLAGIAPEGAVYDIGTYITFAVWGFPVWLLNRLFDVDIMSVGSLLWFKAFLVVLSFWSVKILMAIAKHLEIEETRIKMISIVYLLSPMIFFPVMVAAQYDIIAVILILYGVLYYLKEYSGKKYIVFFGMAIIIKPFALLPFVAIVLMREKKILKIILRLCEGMIPFFLCKGIYLFNEGHKESSGAFIAKMLPEVFKFKISGSYFDIPIFIVILFLIYIYCFNCYMDDSRGEKRRTVILISCIWMSFAVFMGITPYWSVYLAPFLILMIFLIDSINVAMVLDLFFNIAMILVFVMKYPWVYGGQKTFSYLLLKPLYEQLTKENEAATVAGILRTLGIETAMPIIVGILYSVTIALMVLALKDVKKSNSQYEKIQICHIRIRILLLYFWIILNFSAFILGAKGY